MNISKKNNPGLFSFLRRHLNYKKHSVTVTVLSDGEGVELYRPEWSGGSKSAYCWLNTLGSIASVRFESAGWPTNPKNELFTPGPKVALVSAGTFCGKAAYAHLYIRESDLSAFGISAPLCQETAESKAFEKMFE